MTSMNINTSNRSSGLRGDKVKETMNLNATNGGDAENVGASSFSVDLVRCRVFATVKRDRTKGR